MFYLLPWRASHASQKHLKRSQQSSGRSTPEQQKQGQQEGGKKRISLLMIVLLILSPGCLAMKLENAQRLMNREDFEPAAQAAPEWVRDALKTINQLEEQLEAGQ